MGRPLILDDNEESVLKEKIIDSYNNKEPMTYYDVCHFIGDNFHKFPSIDTIRHIVKKMDGLKCVIGTPIEKERINIDDNQILDYFVELSCVCDNLPSSLVINIDESGFQEYCDSTEMHVIVPSSYLEDTIDIPVNRNTKRATFLGSIAADGSYLAPMIVVPRKTLEVEVLRFGLTSDKVLFRYQCNGFINTTIFEDYIIEVLIPYLKSRKDQLGWEHHAVIILDNCSCHMSQKVADECENQNIILIFIPPHSSHLLQPLLIGIFGIHKQAQSRIFLPRDLNVQSKQIIKMYSGFQSIANPPNIISAFKSCGTCSYVENGTLFLMIDPNQVREKNCEFVGIDPIPPGLIQNYRIKLF